jgi:hypothetical protein
MLVAVVGSGGNMKRFSLALLALAAGLGCDSFDDLLKGGGQACTLIGCSDSFNVTVKPLAGEFPAGNHEVVITAEGSAPRTCTFKFPFPDNAQSATCDGGVMLTVWPVQTCTTKNDGNTASQSCVPVPGKFEERLSIPGLPSKVRVTQRTLGGASYLDREATPSYADVYPNGKECGAVCKQDGAVWEF